jgi:hypothetical protein
LLLIEMMAEVQVWKEMIWWEFSLRTGSNWLRSRLGMLWAKVVRETRDGGRRQCGLTEWDKFWSPRGDLRLGDDH